MTWRDDASTSVGMKSRVDFSCFELSFIFRMMFEFAIGSATSTPK